MEVVAAIVTGVVVAGATAIFTARFYVHQTRADLEKEFQARFNVRRWVVYGEFADLIFRLMQASIDDKVDKEMPNIVKAMRAFMSKVWLVGSDKVVREILRWRRHQATGDAVRDGVEQMILLVSILVAMRKDLGDTTTDVRPKELLGTFVNEIDKYVDEQGAWRSPSAG